MPHSLTCAPQLYAYASSCLATLTVLLFDKDGFFLSLHLQPVPFRIKYPSILFSVYYQGCLISWTPCGFYSLNLLSLEQSIYLAFSPSSYLSQLSFLLFDQARLGGGWVWEMGQTLHPQWDDKSVFSVSMDAVGQTQVPRKHFIEFLSSPLDTALP